MKRDALGRIARAGGLLIAACRSRIEGVMKKPITHTRNPDGTETVHAVVRVLLYRDGRHFIAQGLEVDYCAAGDNLADAKQNFVRGFIATIAANLDRFGTLNNLISPAPAEFFRRFYAAAADLESEDMDLPVTSPQSMRRLQFFEGEALSAA